jgi:hypothetical protein
LNRRRKGEGGKDARRKEGCARRKEGCARKKEGFPRLY